MGDPDLVRLNLVPGITPRAVAALREAFGDPRKALGVHAGRLAGLSGVGPVLAARLADPPTRGDGRREIRRADRRGIRILHPEDEKYPHRLRQIPDPPIALSLLGEERPEKEGVAVVGARRASVYGLSQAERFGAGIARAGLVVVSGLARGVDAAAHRGALDAPGVTVAVLGCGLDRVYPPEHRRLAGEVARRGFLCSELPLGAKPLARHFPMRNRIIAGLVGGVVVVEGRIRSGSLITARLAADFGRDVFCVPGRLDTELAAGPHSLLRDGAILVTGPDDVLRDRGYVPVETPPAPDEPADPLQVAILAALDTSEPRGMEEILDRTGAATPAVLSALTELELSGRVRKRPGRLYVLPPVRRPGG